ncbi:TPA: hypothetical protein ACP2P7_001958 [Escherichia coli]
MITNTKLDPIETASVDELQALQTQRLKWTLKHAYENVPMYRRKFDAAGVHPDDFRELSDLRKFPCTTKQDLRDNYPFDTFAVPMEQVVRIHASSGTRLLPGTARTMRRMDRISGRSDDMLIIRGVNVFPSQLEEEIVKFEHLSPHYQLEVNRRGHLDSLSVKVELKESSLTLTHEQRCQVCHQLRHRIKSMVGISTDVMIVNCGSIPRSEGKACRVFDLRNIVGA